MWGLQARVTVVVWSVCVCVCVCVSVYRSGSTLAATYFTCKSPVGGHRVLHGVFNI